MIVKNFDGGLQLNIFTRNLNKHEKAEPLCKDVCLMFPFIRGEYNL